LEQNSLAMRNTILLFLLLMSVGTVSAQWTINESDFPDIGDSAYYVGADTTGVTPGAGGIGQTWNFGSLVATGPTLTSVFKIPTSHPQSGNFPEATVVDVPSNGKYNFHHVQTDSAFLLGEKSQAGTNIDYSDPLCEMLFPFNLNDVITDSILAIYPDGFISNVDRKGEVSVTYDGAGTLITPNATYNNVIRVHRAWTVFDSSWTGLTDLYISKDEYLWYEQGTHLPVMRYYKETSVFNSSPSQIFEVWYSVAFPAGLENSVANENGALNVFPSPATSAISIEYSLGASAEVWVNVYDVSGNLVRSSNQGQQTSGIHKLQLDIEALAPGIYTAAVVTGENCERSSFIVE
jgi:hypothetical protein